MGSNVVSGSATGIVLATGNHTYLGTIAKNISGHRAATAFDKGISKVSILLIRFMLVMIPFVFLINGLTKGDWLETFIFAVSVAVGLTPEMLPMIVTANLSKGAIAMPKKKTIVKDLNAIQNFGAMNILCTDKLQEQKNTVGFLGDGINDASALRQSDIGISVDSAVDIAKESADIILLEKDLMVLEDGILEGRKTFGNMTKYIKMTASSNFGNMFSVMAASAFLPFLPMQPIHLLIQNLLYDISQTTIPFDRMDTDYLRKPRKWDASDLSRFMIFIGPISSIFDIVTYLVMWHVFGCNSVEHQALFQSGWFVEGLLSQTLIVHMIRTRKIPFIQSRASWSVTGLTLLIMVLGIIIPFTSFGKSIGLEPLPLSYFPWLIGILLSYCVLTQAIKNWYIRKFVKWL